jgi:catechol 2,3-dioxygenase
LTVGSLPDDTSIGVVHLVVRDLDRSVGFYRQAIGLEEIERDGGVARMGAGGTALLELRGEPEAPPRPPRTTGLFHFAILVPSRPDLAASLARLASAGWRLTGASDHLVSEALYLNDPDGIGIEIYRDRPREEWEYDGDAIRMATLPLDLEAILAELRESFDPEQPVAAGTRIGHVHLNVADLAASERFYVDGLGLDVTVRTYPGALFVSAGGYHHHLGLNTWGGEGVPSPPDGAIGLERFELAVPGAATPVDEVDPAGIRVRVVGA